MNLPMLALTGGIALLWVGAEALVKGAATLGTRLGISPIVVGLTLVSIGTSAPELAVCLLAAMQGSPDLAVGNVLGSNLANVGLILGITAVFRPLAVRPRVVTREIPWMLGVTLLLFPLMWDLDLGRLEGSVLAAVLIFYLISVLSKGRGDRMELLGAAGVKIEQTKGARVLGARDLLAPIGLIAVGSVGLVIGGRGIVYGATDLAASLGLSEMVIGLSIVAVGTSLPELATTLVAAYRDEADLAVGNIVGSNIFNLTFVLGTTALVAPIAVLPRVLSVEYLVVVAMSVLLLPIVRWRRSIGRREGIILLLAYVGGWVWIYLVK